MSECTRLSDRIPEVALGRAHWTPDQAAHLRGCPACRAELALVQATIGLGRRAPRLSDPEALVSAVERRLVQGRGRRAWIGRMGGLAAAAVLLLAVWTRWPAEPSRTAATTPRSAGAALVPLPELELLEPAELDSLLERMEAPLAGSSTLDAPSLGDLEDTELEQVLATWEG